jgi:hypothetical protein
MGVTRLWNTSTHDSRQLPYHITKSSMPSSTGAVTPTITCLCNSATKTRRAATIAADKKQ